MNMLVDQLCCTDIKYMHKSLRWYLQTYAQSKFHLM